MSINYLLLMIDSEGSDGENTTSVTETFLVNYNDIKNGYNLEYPSIGEKWRGPNISSTFTTDLICSSIQYTRESKKFYSADPNYSAYNGADCVTLKATYTINYNKQESAFTKRISGSGYKTFKMNNGGAKWLFTKDKAVENPKSLPVAENQIEFEYKVPISQIDLKTNFIGNIDEVGYDLMRNKINDDEFLGRPKGTVLFESYTITPKIQGDTVRETELTLTFKVLSGLDWNTEFRNKCNALNSFDGKKLYWQDKFQGRCDYIYDYTELGEEATPYNCYLYDCVKSISEGTTTYYTYAEIKELLKGLPIWSGAILRTVKQDGSSGYDYERCGNYDLSTEGFDVRYWLKNPANGDTKSNRQYLYDYGDFDSLLTGFPIINEYVEPTPPENSVN